MCHWRRLILEPETAEQIWRLFFPTAVRQLEQVKARNTRFVHYTSAESAVKILRSQRMLLRNSTIMNDFSEVQHGINCLGKAYNGNQGDRLKAVLQQVQSDLPEIIQETFNSQIIDVRSETYIISISEHGDPDHGDELEDTFGRLSMWRAYANRNGVAFVFNNAPFLTESNAINAFSMPVNYATPDSYCSIFGEIIEGLEGHTELLKVAGGQYVHDTIIEAFRFAVQSTKHPSFREEREWRVIYSPTLLQRKGEMTEVQLERIPTEVKILGGVPQRVYAIPFWNHPEEGFVGATVPELIDRVLVGPSPDAYPIAQALVSELANCGVSDADQRVWITGVPLRV